MRKDTRNKTMKIGMIIAVEINAFIKNYAGAYEKLTVHGFDVYSVKSELAEIFAIHSKAGQIFSSAATMLLINEYNVDMCKVLKTQSIEI